MGFGLAILSTAAVLSQLLDEVKHAVKALKTVSEVAV
jgi:hypothetical protein